MAAPLTPTHYHQLKRFVRLVTEMDRCRFISAYRANDQTIGAGTDENGVEWQKHPSYDAEDFRSYRPPKELLLGLTYQPSRKEC